MMSMKIEILSFTEKGFALACSLAQALGGHAVRCGQPDSLQDWTKKHFFTAYALVFVGAVGIAVRAVGPYADKKWKDPAVVAVDECAQFVIPLLSGHLGGANSLARKISFLCGAQPVITTATDVNGVFAVDEWARCQNLAVKNPEKIKEVSGKLLAGDSIGVCSRWTIRGECPSGIKLMQEPVGDVLVSINREVSHGLVLIPKIVVLGIGCRKGTSEKTLEAVLELFLEQSGLEIQAVCGVASIDLKRNEEGLLRFCHSHGWPFVTCTAQELQNVSGSFTSSEFVHQITGVDNVCERSAVAVSTGALYHKKFAMDGVTMAAALKPFVPSWDWKDA